MSAITRLCSERKSHFISNAYNCNKLSEDVYLYQITLENGPKCLHKFRYKSFNIGFWSLFRMDIRE